jgi:hypothetical protein
VLRRIFGIKRKQVMGGWRTLHSEELRNLVKRTNIRVIKSRRFKMDVDVICMVEKINTYKVLV